MRLRDFFRGQNSSTERKSTIQIQPIPDTKTVFSSIHEKENELFQKYLSLGFEIENVDQPTQSRALHVAAESGNALLVEILLEHGAKIDVLDQTKSTPLHLAVWASHDEVAEILVKRGANIFSRDAAGRTVLHICASVGNFRLVEYFLSMGKTSEKLVQIVDEHRWTALMCAGVNNHSSIFSRLLDEKSELTVSNDQEMTVVHLLSFLGSFQLLQVSLSSMKNEQFRLELVNKVDQKNRTALFYACAEGHLQTVEILLEAGADCYHIDDERQTCLHWMLTSSVILYRHIRLFYFLIQLVDFRSFEDFHQQNLIDLAVKFRFRTIYSILDFLQYKTKTEISVKNRQILSLKQRTIQKFKTSIVYRQTKQEKQSTLLRICLDEIFQLEKFRTTKNLEEKSEKFFSSTSNVVEHPSKELARKLFDDSNKIQEILDFPPLESSPFLIKDLNESIEQNAMSVEFFATITKTIFN